MIFKVQRSIFTSGPSASVLIYNRGKSLMWQLEGETAKAIIDVMGDRLKLYCDGGVDSEGNPTLGKLVADQPW